MARLAAFDMDGTLLMPDHRLGDETLAVLRQLRERDMTLAFATGRHALEMRELANKLELDAWLITGNGTRIHNLDGEQLYGADIAADVAEEVLHTHWDTTASMHVFNDRGWLTDIERPEMLVAHAMSGFRYHITDLKRLSALDVTKICFIGDHDALCHLRIQLNAALGARADICFSAFNVLEILPVGCNKGSALAVLAKHLGLTLDDCMAFGDAMNDREMLSQVGHGVIMGNAMPQLLTELPHLPVIGHCQRQAVSHYLRHWLETPNLPYSPE